MPKKKTNRFRMFVAVERLAPAERKRIFADNLDGLLKSVGLQRKEAAEQIGIPYKLMRRLVSAGVSRLEDRNQENIEKIVLFFGLVQSDELWQPQLLNWLLNPEYGDAFINRFRDQLSNVNDRIVANDQKVDEPLSRMIRGAIDVGSSEVGQLEKIEAILASSKATQFECLIDDYYKLISDARLGVA